ncbi:MAG: hypothetical protein ACKV2O_05480 [Acidimicrobiales bacterium]
MDDQDRPPPPATEAVYREPAGSDPDTVLQLVETSPTRRRKAVFGVGIVALIGLLAVGVTAGLGRGDDPAPVITEGDAEVIEAIPTTMPAPLMNTDPRWAVHQACLAANGPDVSGRQGSPSMGYPQSVPVGTAPTTTWISGGGYSERADTENAPNGNASTTTLTTLTAEANSGASPATTNVGPAPTATTAPSPPYLPVAPGPPTVEQRAVATAATTACRAVEPGSKEQRAWYGCLDSHGAVIPSAMPYQPEPPLSRAAARSASEACAHLRPPSSTPGDPYNRCLEEHGVGFLWVFLSREDADAGAAACQEFAPKPQSPPVSPEYVQCVFDAGFPRDAGSSGQLVDVEVARAAGAACQHLAPPTDHNNCMARYGIYLHLPAPVQWPDADFKRAMPDCPPPMPELPAEIKAWYSCLADNGARVSLPAAAPPDPTEPATTSLDVARAAMRACESLNPDPVLPGPEMSEDLTRQHERYRGCLDEQGLLAGFPGIIEGVQFDRAYDECQVYMPQPPGPEVFDAWLDCLTEHGLKAPYDPATIDLDAATKALEACQDLETFG